jgi:hypothetical protein
MIYCGYGSDFGKVLVLVPAPDPDHILPFLYKILLFQRLKQHYFPESWPLIFDFCIPFDVGSGSKSVSGTGHGKRMHTGSDSTLKAKSYGSGSTTLQLLQAKFCHWAFCCVSV